MDELIISVMLRIYAADSPPFPSRRPQRTFSATNELIKELSTVLIGISPKRVAESSLKMHLLRYGQGLGLWDKMVTLRPFSLSEMVIMMRNMSHGFGIYFLCLSHIAFFYYLF